MKDSTEKPYDGFKAPPISEPHRLIAVGLGATMWFWMMYRAYHDGPALIVCLFFFFFLFDLFFFLFCFVLFCFFFFVFVLFVLFGFVCLVLFVWFCLFGFFLFCCCVAL